MEFFLVARNLDPANPIEAMMGRSGRPAAARQAYSMTAVDEFGPVIDDIYDFSEAQVLKLMVLPKKVALANWKLTSDMDAQ